MPLISCLQAHKFVEGSGENVLTPLPCAPTEDDGGQAPTGGGRVGGSLPSHSVVAAQVAMAAQVAALEQLRDKLEAGEPPEKKMALPAEEHQRLLQRALQQNLLAMTAQMPMNIRISNQGMYSVGSGRFHRNSRKCIEWSNTVLKPVPLVKGKYLDY